MWEIITIIYNIYYIQAAYLNLRDNNQAYHNRWGVAELEQPLETNNNIEITREEQMTVEEK